MVRWVKNNGLEKNKTIPYREVIMNLTLMLYLAHFGDKIDILCGIALLLCGLVSFFTIVVSSHDDLAESFKSSFLLYS